MMSLGQPESVPLARSEDSFSDDGLRSEPSFGSLQELEYVDRWPSEAPPPPDDGPRTPRIGPALSLDEGDDDARVVETVDLTTPPRRREKRITGKARASRVHAVTPPAGPDAVAPFTFCSALNLGDFAAPVAGSPARSVAGSVASSGAATPTRAVTPGTPESPVDEDPRGFRRHRPSPIDASSSEESLVKFEEEASLVGRYLGCSVAARFDAAASDSDAEPPLPPAPPELPRSPSSNLDLWLVRRGLGKYLDAVAALGARRVSDLVFIDDDDLDSLGMTPEERAAIRIHVAC